jgi:hypothetical protein
MGRGLNTTQKQRTVTRVLGVAFALVLVVMGAAVFKRVMEARTPTPATPVTAQQGSATVTLYFGSGEALAAESRTLDPCATPADCIASLVAELANGPVGDLSPVIPPDTLAEEVVILGDTATVRLSPSFAAGIPSGSAAEMQAVFAIVNTICRNFPAIGRVALRIGQEASTLGHLDLREPLAPDYSLEKTSP